MTKHIKFDFDFIFLYKLSGKLINVLQKNTCLCCTCMCQVWYNTNPDVKSRLPFFFYRNCHLTITERRSAYNCIFLERSLHLELSLWYQHTNCDKYMLLFLLQQKNNHRNIFTTSTDNENTYKLLSTRETPE